MNEDVLQLVVASGATLVGIAITAVIWQRAKVKTVVWWLGLSLVPISIYLLGLAPLVVDGYYTLLKWYASLSLTPVTWTGVALFGLGVFLMLISRVIPARPRVRKDADGAGKATGPASAQRTAVAPAQRNAPASQSTPADSDLDEVTEILRRRGIS